MENKDKITMADPRKNKIFWGLTIIVLLSGIIANSYFRELAWSLRVVGWILLSGGLVALIAKTNEGKKIWSFAKEARGELNKVVWPTRQETVRTTMVIAAMVIVMAVVMWGVDSILLWLFGRLT